jgi:hypothetical protein
MTAVITRPDASAVVRSMPGWHVVANLTPPEVIASHHLRMLRRIIAAALLGVILLCVAGYAWAFLKTSTAQDEADAASAGTTVLQLQAKKYPGITRIEEAVDSVKGEVASVMKPDVDMQALIGKIHAALPKTMSIASLTLTLTPVAAGGTSGSVGLDTSGRTQIGTVTMTGSGRTLNDLPAFVDRLVRVPGVVNVMPGSNQDSSGVVSYSVTTSLTDQLYSHKYDVVTTGGK